MGAKYHSQGEEFEPSASEANDWTDAANYVKSLKYRGGENPQGLFRHSGIVHVKITSNVDIPRFGFALLKEPMFLPEDTEWDEDTRDEMLGRFCFKADAEGFNKWWDIYNPYRHPVILQQPYNYREEVLVPAVASGLSYCKIGFVDPGANNYNSHPTTCIPSTGAFAAAGGGLPPGPFKIIWMEEDANNDGFRWALVNVCSEYYRPSPVWGTLNEDADINDTKMVTLLDSFPDATEIPVEFKVFTAVEGDLIGAIWMPQTNTWAAWAIKCPL